MENHTTVWKITLQCGKSLLIKSLSSCHNFFPPFHHNEPLLHGVYILGVHVGDIGTKFGYVGGDNGFLRLTHVKIPRENMLMRHAKVRLVSFIIMLLHLLSFFRLQLMAHTQNQPMKRSPMAP